MLGKKLYRVQFTSYLGYATASRIEEGLRAHMTGLHTWRFALAHDRPDAVLLLSPPEEIAISWRDRGVVAVSLLTDRTRLDVPSCIPDEEAIGAMAAAHLIETGVDHLAFVGIEQAFSHARKAGFVNAARDAGYEPTIYDSPGTIDDAEVPRLQAWLSALRSPVGLMACDDNIAVRVIDLCENAGRNVPEEIAVIGVNNNLTQCESASVPLTSVDPDLPAVGRVAGELLSKILTSLESDLPIERPPLLRVRPRGVVVRGSTDRLATSHPLLTSALKLIRAHACERLQIQDLCEALDVSRANLHRLFRAELGRSPGSEVRRQRALRARDLVLHTDLSLTEIASRCGFSDCAHLSREYRSTFGKPPSRFRITERGAQVNSALPT